MNLPCAETGMLRHALTPEPRSQGRCALRGGLVVVLSFQYHAHARVASMRAVQPYEYAIALARWLARLQIEFSCTEGIPDRAVKSKAIEELMRKTGLSQKTLQAQRATANLIPELGQLRNDAVISQYAAYQLGQLPEDDQKIIARHLNKSLLAESPGEVIKDLKDKLLTRDKEIKDLRKQMV